MTLENELPKRTRVSNDPVSYLFDPLVFSSLIPHPDPGFATYEVDRRRRTFPVVPARHPTAAEIEDAAGRADSSGLFTKEALARIPRTQAIHPDNVPRYVETTYHLAAVVEPEARQGILGKGMQHLVVNGGKTPKEAWAYFKAAARRP
jgi:hypothetical protein